MNISGVGKVDRREAAIAAALAGPDRTGQTIWRSALAAAEIVGFTAVAHAQAGGSLPAVGHLLALAGVVFVGVLATLRDRVRLSHVVGLLTVVQLSLNFWFEQTASHPGMAMGGPAAAPGTADAHSMTGMVAAHAVAVVATYLVLLHQAFAFRLLVDLLVTLFPQLRNPEIPELTFLGLPSTTRRVVRISLLDISPRRGPPAASC